jgi:hypothetical protein
MAASASGVANEGLGSDSTASGLLTAAKRLEPGAWQELVDRYSWLILRWCRQEGLSTDDARDVLQAVFLRMRTEKGRKRCQEPFLGPTLVSGFLAFGGFGLYRRRRHGTTPEAVPAC